MAFLPLKILVKLPILISPGKVPIAKIAITATPIQKFPVPIAYICIANVNQHGKKNVKLQLTRSFRRVHRLVCGFLLSMSNSFFANNFHVGRLSDTALNLGDILVKFIQRKSITMPIISVITDNINGDTLIIDQKAPRIPQRIPNHIILHVLNHR